MFMVVEFDLQEGETSFEACEGVKDFIGGEVKAAAVDSAEELVELADYIDMFGAFSLNEVLAAELEEL